MTSPSLSQKDVAEMDKPMTQIERVRCALAMSEAGYKFSVDQDDVAALLFAYDALASQSIEVRRDAIEECAKVADKHRGSYTLKKGYKENMRHASSETLTEIRSEERGEDIAAEMIGRAIRALSQQPGKEG